MIMVTNLLNILKNHNRGTKALRCAKVGVLHALGAVPSSLVLHQVQGNSVKEKILPLEGLQHSSR
jgi:hypothetical protein